MGAKTKITQAPTVTPEQKALLDSIMRGATAQMQGFNLGAGWGGPSFQSYNPGVGYGGTRFDMSPKAAGRPRILSRSMHEPAPAAAAPVNPSLMALQSIARVPGAAGQPGQAGMVNPMSPAAYANRENLVSPVVNPFRRNLGG